MTHIGLSAPRLAGDGVGSDLDSNFRLYYICWGTETIHKNEKHAAPDSFYT